MVDARLCQIAFSVALGAALINVCPVFANDDGFAFFESKIRPVLIEHCYECHSTKAQDLGGGLLLDSRDGLRRGGESGKAIDDVNANDSLLLKALRYETLKMPPNGKLPNDVISSFEKWVAMQAPDPRVDSTSTRESNAIDWQQARSFWSFRSRSQSARPANPEPMDIGAIDTFIAQTREKNRVGATEQADPETWLRRVYIDLIGLPPSAEELDAFVTDTNSDRYERTVDMLLASPAYGTRWGRYWLDLARYADSNGADENHRYPVAWRYRDYVVDAYNRDLPFDQFTLEQLAGDLLPSDDEAEQSRRIIATGFLILGPKMLAEQDKPKLISDLVDEQIDTVGKVFLGLTLGCARCHDHKFDPILSSDYYSLAGIFHSTQSMEHLNFVSQWNERVLPNARERQRIQEYDDNLQRFKDSFLKLERDHRWNAVAIELHQLLGSMHWRLSDALAKSDAALTPHKDGSSWTKILASTIGQEDVFYAWRQLTTESALTDAKEFDRTVKRLWDEKLAKDSKNEFQKRLRKLEPPRTSLDLVSLYQKQLENALRELIESPRKADGKFESSEMQRLYNQLVKTNYFGGFDRFSERLPDDAKKIYQEQKSIVEKMEKDRPQPAKAMATQDANAVKLVAVHVRGNHLQTKGEPLNRDIPRVLRDDSDKSKLQFPEKGSGRLELAQWLVDPANPLTARVIVNRVWQGHFGVGLVPTPSNFGFRGEPPTHPELLDWLSNEFVAQGWSMKWLHRQIVLSATYRLRSTSDRSNALIDPNNRWYWRQNKRRLEAEVLRDTLLAMAGLLDTSMGGEPTSLSASGAKANASDAMLGPTRKTIYMEVNRAALADYFTTFDYVEPGVSVDRRSSTIVPHQSLFLMNHPLPIETGRRIAEVATTLFSNDTLRLAWVTKTILGRSPRDPEKEFVAQFLATSKGEAGQRLDGDTQASTAVNTGLETWTRICRALLLTNEFLYVE